MNTRGRAVSSSISPAKKSRDGQKVKTPSSGEKRSPSSGKKRTPSVRRSPTPIPVPSPKEIVSNKAVAHVEYEFGGPLGAVRVIVGLPLVIYALYFVCNQEACMVNPLTFDWRAAWERVPCCHLELFSRDATLMFCGWMALHVLLERVLPGEVVEGVLLQNNKRLSYRVSGHLQFWVTLFIVTHGWLLRGDSSAFRIAGLQALPLDLVYDNYLGLISASVVFSFALSVFLYAYSFVSDSDGKPKILAKGGNTGDMIYDFFIGRELNPRIGSFDLKEFCELRPGLIGWAVINLGMAFKQYQLRGSVSMSMALMVLFQGGYVWDALHAERAILTTMDITTDGFGFMLAFGDLSWVPFIYTLQARYLVDYDPDLSVTHIAVISAVHFLGYFIFRCANSQKDAFRRDPTSAEVAHLSFMETKRGTRLITSGWWGAARKINYTGDWLITLSWCLLCGYDSPIPYFHAIYFLVLLIHRTIRDDMMCHEKYGEDWLEYKRRVPYVFIPGVI